MDLLLVFARDICRIDESGEYYTLLRNNRDQCTKICASGFKRSDYL